MIRSVEGALLLLARLGGGDDRGGGRARVSVCNGGEDDSGGNGRGGGGHGGGGSPNVVTSIACANDANAVPWPPSMPKACGSCATTTSRPRQAKLSKHMTKQHEAVRTARRQHQLARCCSSRPSPSNRKVLCLLRDPRGATRRGRLARANSTWPYDASTSSSARRLDLGMLVLPTVVLRRALELLPFLTVVPPEYIVHACVHVHVHVHIHVHVQPVTAKK